MSYRRFENTYADLVDCFGAVQELIHAGELNESERRYMYLLADLASAFTEAVKDVHEEQNG